MESDDASEGENNANESSVEATTEFEIPQNSEEGNKIEPLEEDDDNDENLIESRFGEGDGVKPYKSEEGKAFQGDIILTAEQRKEILSKDIIGTRTGKLDVNYRWPKNGEGKAVVRYVIGDGFSE